MILSGYFLNIANFFYSALDDIYLKIVLVFLKAGCLFFLFQEADAAVSVLGEMDAWIICPFFLQGGRYTIEDIHYVADTDRLVILWIWLLHREV